MNALNYFTKAIELDPNHMECLSTLGTYYLYEHNFKKAITYFKKLNNMYVENKLNDLITACSSQVVTLAPSGTFPLASFFTSVTPLIPTQQIEIENQKVKQGDGS